MAQHDDDNDDEGDNDDYSFVTKVVDFHKWIILKLYLLTTSWVDPCKVTKSCCCTNIQSFFN